MGTNCAPLLADLFLFWYEIYFMLSLLGDKDAEVIEDFNSTSRYLEERYGQSDLPIRTSDKQSKFIRYRGPISRLIHLTISDGFVSSKIYDKSDAFDFDIVNFPLLTLTLEIENSKTSQTRISVNQTLYNLFCSKFYRRYYDLVSWLM